MVPELKHNSLISGGKFSDANYITVLTPTELLIYDGNDTHISVSKPPQPSSNSHVTSIRGDRNSAVFDKGATSICGRTGDKFQPKAQKSHKNFHMPTG